MSNVEPVEPRIRIYVSYVDGKHETLPRLVDEVSLQEWLSRQAREIRRPPVLAWGVAHPACISEEAHTNLTLALKAYQKP